MLRRVYQGFKLFTCINRRSGNIGNIQISLQLIVHPSIHIGVLRRDLALALRYERAMDIFMDQDAIVSFGPIFQNLCKQKISCSKEWLQSSNEQLLLFYKLDLSRSIPKISSSLKFSPWLFFSNSLRSKNPRQQLFL